MKSINLALVIIMVALAPACSGDDKNNTDGGGNDSGGGDVGTNDSGGGDSGQPTKANYGGVTFTHTQTKTGNTTTDAYTAAAAFFTTPDGGTSSGACPGTQSGSCCYIPPSQAGDGGTGGTTAVNAGGITAKDGANTIATMTPSGTTYTPASNPPTTSLTWNAGDSLSVTAAGDTVHAFSGAVNAVTLFAGVTPALSITSPIAITRANGFTITWTSGTGATNLVVTALKGASNDGVITCSSNSDSGTMTVPAALLQNLSAGDTGFLVLSRTISSDASPDNATVTLSSGTSETGSATFN